MGTLKSPGTDSIEILTSKIEDVESGNFRFVGCTVKSNFNVLDFAFGPRPLGLYIIAAGETPPADATITWSGQMRASGETGTYNVYRKIVVAASNVAGAFAANDAFEKAIAPTAASATISRETVIARAMSAVDSDTVYAMSNKVNPPLSAEAWFDTGMRTDCSSFVAWCLRRSSKVTHPLYVKQNGGWFETSAVYKDGLHQTGFFSAVDTARPGSLLVYPDKDGKQGHIGIVIAAQGIGVKGVSKVVHCSNGNFKKTGKAIAATGPQAWADRADAIIVDYEGFI